MEMPTFSERSKHFLYSQSRGRDSGSAVRIMLYSPIRARSRASSGIPIRREPRFIDIYSLSEFIGFGCRVNRLVSLGLCTGMKHKAVDE